MPSPKFTIYRIRVNNQGYDSRGRYWGTGAPIFEYNTDPSDKPYLSGSLRSGDKTGAKEVLRKQYPGATFYR